MTEIGCFIIAMGFLGGMNTLARGIVEASRELRNVTVHVYLRREK